MYQVWLLCHSLTLFTCIKHLFPCASPILSYEMIFGKIDIRINLTVLSLFFFMNCFEDICINSLFIITEFAQNLRSWHVPTNSIAYKNAYLVVRCQMKSQLRWTWLSCFRKSEEYFCPDKEKHRILAVTGWW